MNNIHCRTCHYLKDYRNEQGFNKTSKAGWCTFWGRLRYAMKKRNCEHYKIEDYFKNYYFKVR